MTKLILILIVGLYSLSLFFIFCYSLVQAGLVINYLQSKRHKDIIPEQLNFDYLPLVTIQLPIYNELYVVERLIDSIAQIKYPPEKLEIQVLDDSTDETVKTIKSTVEKWQQQGINIKQIQREQRTGFKAGALGEGLNKAKGEFIAIFDADFTPSPEFLMKTIPYFQDKQVGMVQTRWEHINQHYSILTRLQAFGLDAHFSVEQVGRNYRQHFINFNGTAGIWRKKTIEDAGGWQSDTLTEDLDLSYRAQLKGWKFKYLENFGSPAELPPIMSALKSQQYRWTKGAAETAVKNLGLLLHAKLPFKTKIHGFFHLMNSILFICIALSGILSVPFLFLKKDFPQYARLYNYASFFLLSFFILAILYWISSSSRYPGRPIKNLFSFIKDFILFLSMSMGLSLHNAIAVIEGYLGIKTPFIRTPKFNIEAAQHSWGENKYVLQNISLMTVMEGVLSLYFLFGIIEGIMLKDYGLLPFHLMLAAGFGLVFYHSIFINRHITKHT